MHLFFSFLLLHLSPLARAGQRPMSDDGRAFASAGLGLAMGLTGGAMGGISLYYGWQGITAEPCRGDICGLGYVFRPIILGAPMGAGLGTAIGGALTHRLLGGGRYGWVLVAAGVPATLGAAGLLVGPLVEDVETAERLLAGGAISSLGVVPLTVLFASAAAKGSVETGVARQLSVAPMLGTVKGIQVAARF